MMLRLARSTVKTYKDRVMTKLGTRNDTHTVVVALQRNLLSLDPYQAEDARRVLQAIGEVVPPEALDITLVRPHGALANSTPERLAEARRKGVM